MNFVRVPSIRREEEVYDREEVLGRDVKSVFPTETKLDTSQLLPETKRFISESELQDIKTHGQNSGLNEITRPLAEVLRENKAKKEAEFQDIWKNMKIGKNKPLESDELAFLENHYNLQAKREAKTFAEESQQIEAFKQMIRAREAPQNMQERAVEGQSATPSKQQATKAPKRKLQPIITTKKKQTSGERETLSSILKTRDNQTEQDEAGQCAPTVIDNGTDLTTLLGSYQSSEEE